jgi:hypothetical protein
MQKITFGEMRGAGVRRVLIYCSDCKCGHKVFADDGDPWSSERRISSSKSTARAARP